MPLQNAVHGKCNIRGINSPGAVVENIYLKCSKYLPKLHTFFSYIFIFFELSVTRAVVV